MGLGRVRQEATRERKPSTAHANRRSVGTAQVEAKPSGRPQRTDEDAGKGSETLVCRAHRRSVALVPKDCWTTNECPHHGFLSMLMLPARAAPCSQRLDHAARLASSRAHVYGPGTIAVAATRRLAYRDSKHDHF